MNEAFVIIFDAENDDSSNPFKPKGSFQVHMIGTIDSGATFTVQQLPIQVDNSSNAWTTATGSPANVAFTNTQRIVSVNYAYGFKYRILKTGTQSTALTFYAGQLTSNNFLTTNNDMR